MTAESSSTGPVHLEDDVRPYLLLTPGPLSTTASVRRAMMRDVSTWDVDYNQIVESVRSQLIRLATCNAGYTSVLMQGSGTFAVEATLGSVIPPDGQLLVVTNGAYGRRMAEIARRLKIDCATVEFPEYLPADPGQIAQRLDSVPGVTHLAMVHCETTSGLLNPAAEVGQLCGERGCSYVLDAMSSFGGIPLDVSDWNCDFLVSSANKCIQGVPGFGFAICRQAALEQTAGWARSLSLDLHAQWAEMEAHHGKWRYTSPTHTVLAFHQALAELAAEGGVEARWKRYSTNQQALVRGMRELGFRCLVDPCAHSPVITAFHCPVDERFEFAEFYNALKRRGFVIYPGKVTEASTFRIGTIGDVDSGDIEALLSAIQATLGDFGWAV